MVSKSMKSRKKKEARGATYVPEVQKPQRDVPKAKHHMKSKRKYRLLGLAPTPGVYDGVSLSSIPTPLRCEIC